MTSQQKPDQQTQNNQYSATEANQQPKQYDPKDSAQGLSYGQDVKNIDTKQNPNATAGQTNTQGQQDATRSSAQPTGPDSSARAQGDFSLSANNEPDAACESGVQESATNSPMGKRSA